MTYHEEQKVAQTISQALASDDPAPALRAVLGPGVEWPGPSSAEVREVQAAENGILLALETPGEGDRIVQRWRVLDLDRGLIVGIQDFGTRAEAAGHLGRIR